MDFQRKQSYLEMPIQVGVRLRPVLETDDPPSDERVEQLPTGQVTVEGHVFDPTFCLPASVGQQELYGVAIEPLVEMLLQGYNVAVVTFGQTGSGKTHTLVGPDATFAMTEAEFGVLPRAVRHVFAALKSPNEAAEPEFAVHASYLEVGQEEIRDLLNYEAVSYHLEVQFDPQGSPLIPGLTRLECSSVAEVLHCLESGSSMRQTASTAGSDQQAHTVFTVHVHQEWPDGLLLHETTSAFHFVELSGSELQPAPDDPDDFTINPGLLALQDVIEALAHRRPSVPYLCSQLAAVLKDVIGGNCKTLVLCCLSPADTDESLASLQYVRRLPAVHNLVTCGVSRRPLPAVELAPEPGPARQVHPVYPLRHLQPGSPRPDAAKPALTSWPPAGYAPAPLGFPGEAWPPPAGLYPASYGYRGEIGGPPLSQPGDQQPSRGHLLVGQVIGEGQQVVNQAQQAVNQNQQVMIQNQAVMHAHSPRLNMSQPIMNQSQPLMNQNQPLMNQSQPLMNQSQPLMNRSQPLMNQGQPLMDQNQQLVDQNHLRLSHAQSLLQPLLSPGVGQPPALLSRSQPLAHGPLSPALMPGQPVPAAALRPGGGGGVSAVVHPFHHQPAAGRLAELGYTASPPLTTLTELSCQRAALLHENALVDLYQRLHVLELHQLAAAQQAALAAQQRPPAQPPPPPPAETDRREDQLFQLEFAAEQYRRLVSGAERLLRELAADGEQRSRVQQWLCRKQETEECLRPEAESDDELRRLDGAGAGGSGTDSASGSPARQGPAFTGAPSAGDEVSDLGGAMASSLRLSDQPGAQSGMDAPPAETSTPNSSSIAVQQVAADRLQAKLKQLNATLEAKEAQIRALTDTGQPPPTDSGSGSVVEGQVTQSAAAEQAGSRPKSPPSDPLQASSEPGHGSPSSDPPVRRRRRQACTEDDLRVLRDRGDLQSLCERRSEDAGDGQRAPPERQCSPQAPARTAAGAATVADRSVDACDLADPDCDLDPARQPPSDQSVMKREIQKLRDCRDSLHNQRRRINTKVHQGGQLDGAETRRLLELDEAMHAVDEVLEHKAGLLAGGAPPSDARRLLLNQRHLMPRLLALDGDELRLLYCRTFQRLVDQRIDGRDKDLAVADLDAQTDDQLRGLKRLQRMVHDLMKERSHYRRQRDELRRRLHGPRGSAGPPPPAASAAAVPLEPVPAAVVAPLPHSRAASDASSAPEPVLAPTSAQHRLRQMLLSGLSRPAASASATRVTRQRNRVIIRSAAQPAEKRTKR